MVTFEQLKVGQLIQDSEGNIGKIVKIEDIHNVTVDYCLNIRDQIQHGGFGVLCFDPECQYYEESASLV